MGRPSAHYRFEALEILDQTRAARRRFRPPPSRLKAEGHAARAAFLAQHLKNRTGRAAKPPTSAVPESLLAAIAPVFTLRRSECQLGAERLECPHRTRDHRLVRESRSRIRRPDFDDDVPFETPPTSLHGHG